MLFYPIEHIEQESTDAFTLHLKGGMPFLPGQFNMLYQFGIGEVPISISGDPSKPELLLHTIRAIGSVTSAMQKLKVDDEIGLRGPFGTPWPLEKKNCDVVVIAGGIGLAPLRPALIELAAKKEQYQNITLLYGARNPADIIFKKDLENWQKLGIKVETTVDNADLFWRGQVGVVTRLIKKNIRQPKNTLVLICGPEIMIKFSVHELLGAAVEENHIFMSLERHMQCAEGFCGRCQYGPYFLCKDGPVFSYADLRKWFMIKEL